jgi:hypothetical protein
MTLRPWLPGVATGSLGGLEALGARLPAGGGLVGGDGEGRSRSRSWIRRFGPNGQTQPRAVAMSHADTA